MPTWNYAAVHAHGTLSAFDDPERLRAVLHAERTARGPPARALARGRCAARLHRQAAARHRRHRLAVERWEGIWKISQNRTETDRAGVVQGLQAEGAPAAQAMADLMLSTE